MQSRIFVNGRCMRPNIIGINRYMIEITKRLKGKLHLLIPDGVMRVGHAIPWEQCFLPFHLTGGDLLWSPANTGPLVVKNQVITIHDIIPLDSQGWFTKNYSNYYTFLLPRLAKIVRKIITVSFFSKERILTCLGIDESKVITIHSGVGEQFRPVSNEMIHSVCMRYDINNPYLLTVSTFEPRKNLGRLFEAWKMISKSSIDIDLIVVGIPANSARNLGYSKIPENVKIIGYVDDHDLPALYSGSISFIFPSIYEGFGLPILEAMACGTPVITSNTTSIPEIAGNAAMLVDPLNVDEIAEAIQEVIINDQLRDTLRQKGVQHASQFTWEKTSQQVWELLNQVSEEINS